MPYLLINTNLALGKAEEESLLSKCSVQVAAMLGKPERYVMVAIESGITMRFAGSDAPCAYLELKSLGLPEERSGEFSHALCELLGAELGLSGDRIYIEFSSPARHLWGWDRGTF